MRCVFVEAKSVGQLHWNRPDLGADSKHTERLDVFPIEISNSHRSKRDFFLRPVAHVYRDAVIDEIEIDLELPVTFCHDTGAESARRDIERGIPPMVLHWGMRQSCFSDDLRPPVKRCIGVPPVGESKIGPRISVHFVSRVVIESNLLRKHRRAPSRKFG